MEITRINKNPIMGELGFDNFGSRSPIKIDVGSETVETNQEFPNGGIAGNKIETLSVSQLIAGIFKVGVYAQSSNYSAGFSGWKLIGDGTIEAVGITLTGGTFKYGKTSFSDSTNAGYYFGSEGIYSGSASDASYYKQVIADGTFDFKGKITTNAGSSLNGTYLVDSTVNNNKIDINNFMSVPSDENLIGYWSFDDASGTLVKDTSINANNGSINGAGITFVDGVSGKGLSFNGDGSYVNIPNSIVFGNKLSICAWFYAPSFSSTAIIERWNDIGIRWGNNGSKGNILCYIDTDAGTATDGEIAGDYTLDLNTWYFVCFTWDGTTENIYINGILYKTKTWGGNFQNSIADFWIGRIAGGGGWYIGTVDELRIYNKALSLKEVQALYLYINPNAKNIITAQRIAATEVITLSAQIKNAIITDAKIDTLSANKIIAGTGIINSLDVLSTLTMGSAGTNGTIQSYGWNGTANGFQILGGATPSITIIGGTITSGTITIGSGDNVFKADSNGICLGDATFGDAPFRVSMAGALNATSATISGALTTSAGSSLDGTYLTASSVVSSKANIALQGWTQTCVFSASDYRVIAWTAGTFVSSNGTSYSISSGNTGNMAAVTYIYLDLAVSLTVLQVNTSYTPADGKVLIAVATPNTDTTSKAQFQVFGGIGGTRLFVDNISANSASTNEFISNSAQLANLVVTNAKINTLEANKITAGTGIINSLDVLSTLTMGSAGVNGVIKSHGWLDDESANGFKILGGATPSVSLVGGTIIGGTIKTSSSSPKVQIDTTDGVTITGESLWFGVPAISATTVDYNSQETNNGVVIRSGYRPYRGQSFSCSANAILGSCKVKLYKNGSPTGNASAKLYAHTGTYGVDGVPTGSPLATSDNLDITTLTTDTAGEEKTFTFSDLNQYSLVSGTKYVIVIYYNGGDASNWIAIRRINSGGSHGGLQSYSSDEITWTPEASDNDLWFYVYSRSYGTEAGRITASIIPSTGLKIINQSKSDSDSGYAITIDAGYQTLNLKGEIVNIGNSSIVIQNDITLTPDNDVIIQGADILPNTSATTESLGSSSKYWKTGFFRKLNLQTLSGIPADVANGDIWYEADGIHAYINDSEEILAII